MYIVYQINNIPRISFDGTCIRIENSTVGSLESNVSLGRLRSSCNTFAASNATMETEKCNQTDPRPERPKKKNLLPLCSQQVRRALSLCMRLPQLQAFPWICYTITFPSLHQATTTCEHQSSKKTQFETSLRKYALFSEWFMQQIIVPVKMETYTTLHTTLCSLLLNAWRCPMIMQSLFSCKTHEKTYAQI